MKTIFRKMTMLAMLVTLLFSALPLSTSYAAGAKDTATPPAPGAKANPALAKARLEKTFARQQALVSRMGKADDNFEKMSSKAQKLLDKAGEKGLDISAVQAAFDAFVDAFEEGKPLYEQAREIASKRPGFDTSGNVTDLEQARSTVKSLADVIKQHHDALDGTFKALRAAMKAFREANPRPTPVPAP